MSMTLEEVDQLRSRLSALAQDLGTLARRVEGIIADGVGVFEQGAFAGIDGIAAVLVLNQQP